MNRLELTSIQKGENIIWNMLQKQTWTLAELRKASGLPNAEIRNILCKWKTWESDRHRYGLLDVDYPHIEVEQGEWTDHCRLILVNGQQCISCTTDEAVKLLGYSKSFILARSLSGKAIGGTWYADREIRFADE